MKKKLKSLLIRVLRKWLAKLEPYHNVVKVECVHVPLVSICADVVIPKYRPLPEDRINEILAKKLGEDILHYAEIETCQHYDFGEGDQTVYRATVRVAAEKRG